MLMVLRRECLRLGVGVVSGRATTAARRRACAALAPVPVHLGKHSRRSHGLLDHALAGSVQRRAFSLLPRPALRALSFAEPLQRCAFHTAGADRAAEALVIDIDGTKLGVMPLRNAREQAEGRRLELKLVKKNANGPSVYKCIDPVAARKKEAEERRMKRDKAKQAKIDAKKQKKRLKEVQLSAWCSDHDLQVKVNQMRTFLEKGLDVKLTLKHRRGQILDKQKQFEVIERIQVLVEDIATRGDIRPQGIFQVAIFTRRADIGGSETAPGE